MIIKIYPFDTLFFRDGKPYTMGEDTWTNKVFPPYPSVIYGALRSAYFSSHIKELNKANNNDDPTKNLKIKGIYFHINGIYFPIPMDCVKEKEDKKFFPLSIINAKNLISNCPAKYILKTDKKVENIQDALIGISELKKYLSSKTDSFSVQYMKDYVISEPKIGIGISKTTRNSEEGKLYRVDMVRLKNISIIVDFDGLNLSENGMMKLGGEGKAVYYEKYDEKIPDMNIKLKGNRFKLYLSTPAIFNKGWIPEWIDEETLIGNYKGIKLKLLTAVIGKPIYIGGFDMKKREPKPMYKAVPSGSVYYFEIDGDIDKIYEIFNQKAISDIYPEQGFGIVYIGGVEND